MNRYKWTPEREALLADNCNHLCIAELAEMLDTTPRSVRLKLTKDGLMRPERSRKLWNIHRVKILYSGLEEGKSVEEIAKKLGVNPRSVKHKLTRDKSRKVKMHISPWVARGRKLEPGTQKRVNGFVMEYDGRNWKQVGYY